jgi:hypothetical protein
MLMLVEVFIGYSRGSLDSPNSGQFLAQLETKCPTVTANFGVYINSQAGSVLELNLCNKSIPSSIGLYIREA